MKQPRSIAGRSWNLAMDALLPGQLVLIVLKLTRVITWSWWWVLSPVWVGGILVAFGLCGLLALVIWGFLQRPRPIGRAPEVPPDTRQQPPTTAASSSRTQRQSGHRPPEQRTKTDS